MKKQRNMSYTDKVFAADETFYQEKAAEIARWEAREREANEEAEVTGDWSEVARIRAALDALDR